MLEYMAPLMFAGLVVFLLVGYPVAFSLCFTGLAFGLLGIQLGMLQPALLQALPERVLGIELGKLQPALLQALPERVLGIMANSTLLAIPFFTLMGLILERSGMAEELLDTIGQVFGAVRGGIAYAVVFVGALLAATTGVVAASVLAMGLISLPVMMRYGYSNRLSTGVIAASGTLAQIIPPSLVLIVLADQMGVSVGDMYEGALIPGLGLAALYAVWVFVVSVVKPEAFVQMIGTSLAIPLDGLIKSTEELAQERAQAQQAQLIEKLGPEAMRGAAQAQQQEAADGSQAAA